jgi:hypothetical protein
MLMAPDDPNENSSENTIENADASVASLACAAETMAMAPAVGAPQYDGLAAQSSAQSTRSVALAAPALPDDEEAPALEPPRRAPHSRPSPETDGYLKIVLPIQASQRAPWWMSLRSDLMRGLAFARRQKLAVAGTLALTAVLLSGIGYAITDYYAPAAAARGFCSDLQSRDFASAYAMLSGDLQRRIRRDEFQQVGQALDEGEGSVTGCDVSIAPGSYNRLPGATSATTQTSIRRAQAGRQSGQFRLAREGPAWRIASLDAETLGEDVSALTVVSGYCTALRERDYLTAYTLLSQSLQDELSFGQFVTQMRAAEEIDGAIQTCGLVTARGGQSGGKTTLVATARRGFGAAHRGAIILSAVGDHWQISSIDATALGTDLRPLRVATRFCADLTSGALDDAYTLFSNHFQAQITRAQLSDDLRPDAGANWSACAPVLRSYQVEGDQASVDVSLTATFGDGAKNVARARLVFTRVDGGWSLDGVRF